MKPSILMIHWLSKAVIDSQRLGERKTVDVFNLVITLEHQL